MGRRAWVWALLLLVGTLLSAADNPLKLDSTSVTQDGPRVTLRLRFSGPLKYEYIAQYAKNQIILHVPELSFSKPQLKSGLAVGEVLGAVVRGGAYEVKQGYGEIRLQLSKDISPADVQLIPKDTWLDLQFIVPEKANPAGTFVPDKPATTKGERPSQLPKAKAAPLPSQEEGDATEPIVSLTGQTFADPPVRIATGDPVLTTQFDVEAGESEPDSGTVSEPAPAAGPDPAAGTEALSEEPAAIADTSGGYSTDELAEFSGLRNTGAETTALADDPAADQELSTSEPLVDEDEPLAIPPAKPAVSAPSTPSYKRFDLDQIPAKQVEIRDVPFREALLQLVAGSGFNVVVGSDIENESVYLNFQSKQISLKEALETLCIAYELSYTVEDGAIVVTRQ